MVDLGLRIHSPAFSAMRSRQMRVIGAGKKGERESVRDPGVYFHRRPFDRVSESHLIGVECQGVYPEISVPVTVLIVTEYGSADVGELRPDLMESSGVKQDRY